MRTFLSLTILMSIGVLSPAHGADVLSTRQLPPLPTPMANNAVAVIHTEDGPALFSFMGLETGKTWKDTSSKAFALYPWENEWLPLTPVPGDEGRLAGIAVGVGQSVYVIGGYTVAEDHSEKSIPAVHRYNLKSDTYTAMKPMPIPVDDTVAMLYQDRFIYLVSGWHDSGNVNLVQVYDTESGLWFQATPFPGSPVFGHAGGLVGATMVICDGVKIKVVREGNRQFVPSDECYLGKIRQDDLTRIDWLELPRHPGPSRYRMAATGTSQGDGMVVFAGGSTNPYNYDGIGYDGKPSAPEKSVFALSIKNKNWIKVGNLDVASMDHRGLLETADGLVIVGGMRAGQAVSQEVLEFKVKK